MPEPQLRTAIGYLAMALARLSLGLCLSSFQGAVPAMAQQTSQGYSVEGCIGCHALDAPAPVGNIDKLQDLHHIDLHPDGPATPSTYRQLNVLPTLVDVRGSAVVVEFSVTDESDAAVDTIFQSDGTVVIAKLVDGVIPSDPTTAGDPTEWQRLVSERFTSGGTFEHLGGGDYRYTTAFDPTDPTAAGDTLRVALQISASDIPPGNGWCDFDVSLASTNDCVSTPSLTRDIVQTETCNDCHGVTSDTQLAYHGGARTQVEYCVTCHNPDRNADTGMTTLAHKIHYGSSLTQEWRDGNFDHVTFTKDIDNCTTCHEQGGADEDNWKTEPNRESCGSCHDDVNFDTGENHGSGGQQLDNSQCAWCHPSEGEWTEFQLPVSVVHQGAALSDEGASYRGDGNGFAVERASYDQATAMLTVEFSVTRNGQKMDLRTDPRWTNGGRLNLDLAWSTEDYTNEGSNSDPAPAQPITRSALATDGSIVELDTGSYQTVIDVSEFGFGNMTVGLEGYPRTDLRGNGDYTAVPVKSAFAHVSLEPRVPHPPRREVIEMDKCNACHDSGGAGLSFHGTNRTGEMQVCALCHNPNATDLRQRPADPGETPDGKREEAIDMKRMIHQIHMGSDLEDPLLIYGYGGMPHDYGSVNFLGNNKNCLTCHKPGTYSTDDAWLTLPTTIDSGEEVTDPSDDLNISPITAVCSGCHDTDRAKEHMEWGGGSFGSLGSEIATGAAPEPNALPLALAAMVALGALARRRRDRRGC